MLSFRPCIDDDDDDDDEISLLQIGNDPLLPLQFDL